jgi:hypothetical protein
MWLNIMPHHQRFYMMWKNIFLTYSIHVIKRRLKIFHIAHKHEFTFIGSQYRVVVLSCPTQLVLALFHLRLHVNQAYLEIIDGMIELKDATWN